MPKHLIKKGEVKNPTGRPRRPDLDAALFAALEKPVPGTDKTVLEELVTQLCEIAISKDHKDKMKAADLLLNRAFGRVKDAESELPTHIKITLGE